MKRFLIQTSVENAEGSQCWYVDASSEAEALAEYERGGCDLYSSEVGVTSLGEPEIVGETDLSDFGDFSPKPAQCKPLTDRENAIVRFAVHQFMSDAHARMNAAAQDKNNRYFKAGAVEAFAKDAKDAEALLAKLPAVHGIKGEA